MNKQRLTKSILFCVVVWNTTLSADEGIWLFDQFPKRAVEKKYGFAVTDGFLDKLRAASARMRASGSIVSPHGLVFTNHHVASECIQQLSTAKSDFMTNGFYAATQGEEKKCPGMEISVLLSIEDVTGRVNAGTRPDASAQANRHRKANMARIEKECAGATGNHCEMVTLYSGGQYDLYQYKKYKDVRLVFAPEMGIAAFGGDPDNFTYPRYCLDIAFLRIYENDRPADTPNYLRWSKEGLKDGELTFVSGHPATTGRLNTVAQLEFFRDVSYPLVQARLDSLIRALQAYMARSLESKRVAAENLQSQQNSYKAYTGFLAGLRDPRLMKLKQQEEQELCKTVDRDPKLQNEFGKTWENLAAAYREYSEFYKPYWLLETGATRGSDLFRIARHVVRLAEERTKPSEQRLTEYRESVLPGLEASVYSEAPITDSMEIAVLADYFQFLEKALGPKDTTVRAVLDGKTPEKAAEQYVNSSTLKEVAERKRLASSLEAIRSSQDGMIRLGLLVDSRARELRRKYEDRVEAIVNTSAAKVAQARFKIRGTDYYPDATGTLRLSYGPVKGYENNAGGYIPYATTFEGLYRRASGEEPFRLPERWLQAKGALNLNTPFNFVTTADTHGGNSGSPTVNTKGEIIGILFDGNLESLPDRFVYTGGQSRSVHVASQGIVEALQKVYHAAGLLKELDLAVGSD